MAHSSEVVLRRAYAALDAGDGDGFMAAFADESVLHGSAGGVRGEDPGRVLGVIVTRLLGRWPGRS